MRTLFVLVTLGAGLLSGVSYGEAPANAPAGTTGVCNDGTYYSGPTKKGACKGHKGVKDWYGTPAAAAAPATPAATTPAPAPNPPKPAAAVPAPAPQSGTAPATTATPKAAAGGGPGQVWVNMSTKVYHCPGDKWYGKTKQGEFMSEADAKAKASSLITARLANSVKAVRVMGLCKRGLASLSTNSK